MKVGVDVDGSLSGLYAPAVLPDLAGCISSVRHALRGAGEDPARLLESEELRTHTDTALLRLEEEPPVPRWGVLWAQLTCPSLASDWPLGTTEFSWGDAVGAASWLLAAGAGEGEDHIEMHVPPSQRAVWRPLALVRASTIEVYLRDPGCSLQFVYKGTHHPASAPRCSGDAPVVGAPQLLRQPIASWYTPPDGDGQHFTTTSTIRWLTSFAFSSRGAYAMLIDADAPWFSQAAPSAHSQGEWSGSEGRHAAAWHEPDARVTTASECIHGRCAQPLLGCYRDVACQQAWTSFSAHQGKVPWNQTAMDAYVGGQPVDGGSGASEPLRALVQCLTEECTCQARDLKPHAVRFTDSSGLSDEEVESILSLAERIGGSTRRAFGAATGGLASPGAKPPAGEQRRAPAAVGVAAGHTVTYLHGLFVHELPALHAKLVSYAQRAHDESGWAVVDPAKLTVRTIELLEYSGASDSLGWHVDEQSAVTLLVMLCSPDDFEGAKLQHEVRGSAEPVTATMARGDVTAYRSHQAHRVTPLTSGRRRVMAIELWHDIPGSSPLFEQDSGTGEPTAARGRPHLRYGQCPA